MKKHSAREAFRKGIEELHQGNQAAAARDLGISRSMVSRLLKGTADPSLELAERVWRQGYGVEMHWWVPTQGEE